MPETQVTITQESNPDLYLRLVGAFVREGSPRFLTIDNIRWMRMGSQSEAKFVATEPLSLEAAYGTSSTSPRPNPIEINEGDIKQQPIPKTKKGRASKVEDATE